jgi:hypothetical protein
MKNAVFWDVTSCDSCKTEVSEESIASIIRVIRIGELGTTLAATSNRSTLRSNSLADSFHPDDGDDIFIEASVLMSHTASHPRGRSSSIVSPADVTQRGLKYSCNCDSLK